MRALFLSGALLLAAVSPARAGDFDFRKGERILIVAPHPDDETLGAGGVIRRAVEAGAEVRVAYFTHGESNELSSIFYNKKPMILTKDFLKAGQVRKQEGISAMAELGIPEKNLYFLGYPDLGTMRIWERYWTGTKPFRSFFSRVNKVIHKDDFSYGRYFYGYNVLADFERLLREVAPQRIFVTGPFDRNQDHQAAYLFVQAALFELEGELPRPKLHLYVVHAHDWPRPRKPELGGTLEPPVYDPELGIRWKTEDLSLQEARKKEDALLHYKSQLSYAKSFLLSFVRRNEVFADYPFEEVVVEPALTPEAWDARESLPDRSVRYAAGPDDLYIEVPFESGLEQTGALSTSVFGFKKGVPFAEMPKLQFRMFGKKLRVFDGPSRWAGRGIFYKVDESRVLIRVPLDALKRPDFFFVNTRMSDPEAPAGAGAWRAVRLVPAAVDSRAA